MVQCMVQCTGLPAAWSAPGVSRTGPPAPPPICIRTPTTTLHQEQSIRISAPTSPTLHSSFPCAIIPSIIHACSSSQHHACSSIIHASSSIIHHPSSIIHACSSSLCSSIRAHCSCSSSCRVQGDAGCSAVYGAGGCRGYRRYRTYKVGTWYQGYCTGFAAVSCMGEGVQAYRMRERVHAREG